MDFKDLTDEQKAKARACTSPEELVALAKSEGVELSDEQLDAISGGREWYQPPSCSERTYSPYTT